jgi:carbon-monoxide dehydrogenase small subunit
LAKNGELNPVQKSFIKYGGFQCGICTPGQVVAATALLNENPKPNEEEIKDWMMGNLCRCTGYYKIIESIEKAHQFAK